jgi:hypothetical protein
VSHYRPISLLTTFSQVLEKVMHNRSSHYFQTNSILVPEQFTSRKGIATGNAAFKLTGSVFKSINETMHVDGIFCDLLKAFGRVNYEILLTESHFCIGRATASLLRS